MKVRNRTDANLTIDASLLVPERYSAIAFPPRPLRLCGENLIESKKAAKRGLLIGE